MSDPSGPVQRDRERFLKSIPAHLEALRKARDELTDDPDGASKALVRVSGYIAEEAGRHGLTPIEEAAKGVVEGGGNDGDALRSLEGALEGISDGGSVVRVLIVEDDPVAALLSRTALDGPGRKVEVAGTAAEARQRLSSDRVDLIVLDLVLPDADGRHLLMELSRELDSNETAVVVVTAKGTPATRAECFAFGASAFLEKPLDVEALRSVTADVLAIGSARRRESTGADHLPDRLETRDAFLRMQSDLNETSGPLVLALVDLDPDDLGWDEDGQMSADSTERAGRVSEALRESLNPGDVMGRWGVSELVLLFLGREAEACVRVLERAQGRAGGSPRPFLAGVTEVERSTQFEDAVSWADRLVSEARMTADAGILHTTLATTRAPFVLIVEDDPITASLLQHRLERSGFEVEHHENGLHGLEAIRRTLPDLVVLDIRLPGMDGFEILSRMQAEGLTQDVRTIVLTGLGRESDVSRAFGLGADDYLVKPFSPIELTARALRLVRR